MEIAVTSQVGEKISADLYSDEGMRLVTDLWLKASFHHRVMYEPTWLGIPIIQLPNDIVLLQELLWKLRPDVVVETGVAHGGSAVFYASILELLGRGKVIGIDVEIRKYNRLAIECHPLSRRIELIEGSSIDPTTVETVRKRMGAGRSVLVSLDSNHCYEHVLREMEIYSEFVSPGGYMVVMDGVQEMLSDTPSAKAGWEQDNPLAAIRDFLSSHREWRHDPHYTRTHITCNPSGFLQRIEEV